MKRFFCSLAVIILLGAGVAAADYLSRAEIEFRTAENKYEMGKFSEAIYYFNRLLPLTDDQNKIDSAHVRMADCLFIMGQKELAIRLYKLVFMDKRYSMIKTIAFWKWRTTYQLNYWGVGEDAKIPNKLYNRHRERLHNCLRRYSKHHPLSISPLSQMKFLRELPNLSYDEKKGPSVLAEFRSLYPEFRARVKKRAEN
ncbi:MAG TPA: hypothetical protein P5287_05025 [bacterium]|nr:hypothetical protein [bacterium]